MNAPTYQRKDYSYLPQAFAQASQGFGQIGQGLKTAMDIGDRERKREQEDEYLAKLKISREDQEKVRETAIVEAATQFHEAMGLPDTEAGFDQALKAAEQVYYKITADEWKNGTGMQRINRQEQDVLPGLLNKAKMKTFRSEYLQGTTEEKLPERRPFQEPVGAVGVEEEGAVKEPLSTFAQSKEEMQRSAEKELAAQERYLPTLTRQMTSEDAYNRLVELGLTDNKEARELVGLIGQKEVTQREREEPTYRGPTKREVLEKPVVRPEAKEWAETYPEEISPKEKEELRIKEIKAKRPAGGGAEVKLKDLLAEARQLENTKRQISTSIATIDDKLRNPMRINRDAGESEESLNAERQRLKEQFDSVNARSSAVDSDLAYTREQMGYPAAPKPEAATGPSTNAQNIARDILKSMSTEAPKGYAVVSRFGKPTWAKGKGPKTQYFTDQYNLKLADELLNFAQDNGVTMGADRMAGIKNVQRWLNKISVEEFVDRILKQKGNK